MALAKKALSCFAEALCSPAGEITKRDDEVDAASTPNPNNQTELEVTGEDPLVAKQTSSG